MNEKISFGKAMGFSLKLTYSSNKMRYVFYLILRLLTETCPLLAIYFLKRILDEVLQYDAVEGQLFLWIALFIVTTILRQVINYILIFLESVIRTRIIHQYDLMVSRKLAELPMSFIDTSHGRDTVDYLKYSKDEAIKLTNFISNVFFSTYTFIISFLTLINFSIFYSFLFLALTIPGVISQIYIGRKMDFFLRKSAPDIRKSSYYRWMLTDPWPAKDVRMYNLTNPIKERYNLETTKFIMGHKRLDLKKLTVRTVTELIKRSGEIVFIFFVISKALAGDILVGDATLYIGFALQATMAFENVTYILLTIYYIGAKRLEKLIQFLAMPVEKQSGQVMPVEEFHSLTFEDVHFTYPLTDKPVLKGVSFSLKKGEKLSIVGINGSGKTTIVKLMLGLYTPQSGRIFINGRPMADYDIAEVRKQFSVLFQDFVQYPLTLRDNVAMSDISRIDDDEEIIAALKLSGIYDEYSKFSNGLDTDMTRRFADEGVELSKGQWQKVALSRAYFKNAPIIILDEPSAALDAEAEDRIFRQFAEISGNRTGIIISHRISGSKLADKIIVLDDGKIVESGKHTDLISQDGLYAKLYNLQLQKYALKEETVDA